MPPDPNDTQDIDSSVDASETSPGKRKLRPQPQRQPAPVKRSRAEIHQQAVERKERLAKEKAEAEVAREKKRVDKEKARRESAKRIAGVEDAIQLTEKQNRQQSDRPDLATQRAYRQVLSRSVLPLPSQVIEADPLGREPDITLRRNDEDGHSDAGPPESTIPSSESDQFHGHTYTHNKQNKEDGAQVEDGDDDFEEDEDFEPPAEDCESESDESLSASEQTQSKKANSMNKVSKVAAVRSAASPGIKSDS